MPLLLLAIQKPSARKTEILWVQKSCGSGWLWATPEVLETRLGLEISLSLLNAALTVASRLVGKKPEKK